MFQTAEVIGSQAALKKQGIFALSSLQIFKALVLPLAILEKSIIQVLGLSFDIPGTYITFKILPLPDSPHIGYTPNLHF